VLPRRLFAPLRCVPAGKAWNVRGSSDRRSVRQDLLSLTHRTLATLRYIPKACAPGACPRRLGPQPLICTRIAPTPPNAPTRSRSLMPPRRSWWCSRRRRRSPAASSASRPTRRPALCGSRTATIRRSRQYRRPATGAPPSPRPYYLSRCTPVPLDLSPLSSLLLFSSSPSLQPPLALHTSFLRSLARSLPPSLPPSLPVYLHIPRHLPTYSPAYRPLPFPRLMYYPSIGCLPTRLRTYPRSGTVPSRPAFRVFCYREWPCMYTSRIHIQTPLHCSSRRAPVRCLTERARVICRRRGAAQGRAGQPAGDALDLYSSLCLPARIPLPSRGPGGATSAVRCSPWASQGSRDTLFAHALYVPPGLRVWEMPLPVGWEAAACAALQADAAPVLSDFRFTEARFLVD
jgi:hypothetical protein